MTAVLLCAGLWLQGCAGVSSNAGGGGRETVLLLHGMGRTAKSMSPLERRLEQAGYDVRCWSYPSLSEDTARLAARLRCELDRLGDDPSVSRVHLVGHSLGGVLARAALLPEPPPKIGRVVLLAPPNQGSAAARVLAPLLGRFLKPLEGLSDAPGSAVQSLGQVEGVEIGVIAAAWDGKVPVQSTHLEEEADHVVVKGFHSFLMNQRVVQDQVLHFLREGKFSREDPGRTE
ncbi:MAG: alpha/beta fold hydrolase [Planctomycetes bacterium]|nr:alpha/beta fold hydrolase [Planctomycetota bacterium]